MIPPYDSETYQATWYIADAESRRLRPERRAREHLPPDRRDGSLRLAERPLLRRSAAQAVGRRRRELDLDDARQLHRHRDVVHTDGRHEHDHQHNDDCKHDDYDHDDRSDATTSGIPTGCTGVCASALKAAATACISKLATKAGCKKALSTAQLQFALLEKQQLKAKGIAKTKLKLTLAGFTKLLTTYNAAAKKLKH